MFNSKSWANAVSETYGYKCKKVNILNNSFYISQVSTEIGRFDVAPPFGDFIFIKNFNQYTITALKEKFTSNPIKMKICSNNLLDEYPKFLEDSGFIHQIEFESYNDWEKPNSLWIQKVSENKYIKDLQIRRDSSQEVLKQFWQLHTKLRLNKFMEIPQPFNFFSNIYEEFFKKIWVE